MRKIYGTKRKNFCVLLVWLSNVWEIYEASE